MIATAEVLIVGAGPAGCVLACLLADRGIEAMVVDRARFPRHKPCGETLNPGVVRQLRELDLLSCVSANEPASIAGWRLDTERDCCALGMYGQGQYGMGMPRRDFDASLLHEAKRRGVKVLEGMHVNGLVRRGSFGFDVSCREDGKRTKTIRARFVVGADGLRSVISRRLGLVGRAPRLRKFSITYRLRGIAPRGLGVLRVANGCTVGLAPVHATEPLWNGTVVLPSHNGHAADLRTVYESYLSHAVRDWDVKPVIVDGPWTSGPFDRPAASVWTRDVLLVGDAAGYFDPLTGQGVFQALRTARLAAEALEAVCSAGDDQAVSFGRYASGVRREQVWTRAFQRAVEAVLSHERARNFAVRQLAEHKRYMDRLVRVAGDSLPVRGLARLDLLARKESVTC